MDGVTRSACFDGLWDWGDCLSAAPRHLGVGFFPRPKGGPESLLRIRTPAFPSWRSTRPRRKTRGLQEGRAARRKYREDEESAQGLPSPAHKEVRRPERQGDKEGTGRP